MSIACPLSQMALIPFALKYFVFERDPAEEMVSNQPQESIFSEESLFFATIKGLDLFKE